MIFSGHRTVVFSLFTQTLYKQNIWMLIERVYKVNVTQIYSLTVRTFVKCEQTLCNQLIRYFRPFTSRGRYKHSDWLLLWAAKYDWKVYFLFKMHIFASSYTCARQLYLNMSESPTRSHFTLHIIMPLACKDWLTFDLYWTCSNLH